MNGAESAIRKPFIEHVYELRKRALISVLAIMAGGLAGYMIHESLLNVIQKPLGQTLFYTSPTGGFSFIFKLCLLFGLVVALPVIVYQLLKFLSPLIKQVTKRFILLCLLCSVFLAIIGVLFAYFISLPAALHFLTSFGGQDIQALITADAYFNFALAYIGGFAVLFQLPLILLLINRAKPLKPGPLMRFQRYVLLGSFIIAAVLTPTPDPINQAMMAVPVILLYQISIVLIWLVNMKPKKHGQTTAIIESSPSSRPFHPVLTPIQSPAQQNVVHTTSIQTKFIDIMPGTSRVSRNASFSSQPIAVKHNVLTHVPPGRLIDMVKT